jgi:hypothetical protein
MSPTPSPWALSQFRRPPRGKDILHRAILGLCFLGVLEDVLYRFDGINVGTAILSNEKEDSVEPRVGPNG